ncbi:MAG: FliI/YscN family ATPase [candidate division Zixibacteria bacterium]|nr:FliI/YscN family ATPase [candidate division Zixibacteria bacterium]
MNSIAYSMYADRINRVSTVRHFGKVTQVVGLVIEAAGPAVSIGRLCTIENRTNDTKISAEVVGFRDDRILLMPYGTINGITPGAIVTSISDQLRITVGKELLGRVLGGLGQPIDHKGAVTCAQTRPINAQPIPVMSRRRITQPIRTGIKVVDTMTVIGQGQRMGIFAGSGVGKSVMLGMIARGSSADVNVIALIGERGREVREFIERDLGPEGLKRSVVVAVSSDEPALVRIKGAMVATTIAEYFRDQGLNVMLLLDSITRVAMAQREIGLAVGEPPATKGYTPSVFALLPSILERAGSAETGSITGLYTVLVEGDDFNEPISDAVRSILDGHIMLSRKYAAMNQYPAVDFLDSISRLMTAVSTKEEQQLATQVREIAATYRESEDLISIGAYAKGTNPRIDRAVSKIDALNQFFRQGIDERVEHSDAVAELSRIIAS